MKSNVLSAVLFLCANAASAATIFNDDFEEAAFDPFWTVSQDFGTATLSSDVAFSGSQSAKFQAGFGGQRSMSLSHSFANPQIGKVSVRLYDSSPGTETLYTFLGLFDSVSGGGISIGFPDYDAFCYSADAFGGGPNQSCGVFPGMSTTNVSRTVGWHLLEAEVTPTKATLSIDGVPVYVHAGVGLQFDQVSLSMFGPFWRPAGVSYWDDFSLETDDAPQVPEPASAALLVLGLSLVALRRHTLNAR